MRPIDALTDIDENLIRAYISIYGNAECGPLNLVLNEWNKNKLTLFKAFGKKLTVSKNIIIPSNDTVITSALDSIFHPYIIWYSSDVTAVLDHPDRLEEIVGNKFLCDLIIFWVNQNYCIQDLRILSRLFLHRNFIKGYISTLEVDLPYHCRDFKCTLKNGMKTIRTIQKVLKATHYPNMDLFEEWRNQISLIQKDNEISAKLVLSIHPIDFMSMSDNKCNWSSCMRWSSGCYSAGTLEMMNSNVAAVAYLESSSPFELSLNETGEVYNVPNKSWRSLVFIHKDILLCGKQYPYHNDFLTTAVLDFARELVEKNLNWKYQFINQRYRDLDNIDGNFYIRDWFNVDYDTKKKHHCIFVYTNGMYNDIIESHYPYYYCCRNYVPKSKKICLSGPATCICCGKRLTTREDIYEYDDLGKTKICWECQRKCCRSCGKVNYYSKYHTRYGVFCSDYCVEDTIVFPLFNKVCRKENLQFNYQSKIAIFCDDTDFPKTTIFNIMTDFHNVKKEEVDKWIDQTKIAYPQFRFYKIPKDLSGYRFADIEYSHPANSHTNADCYYTLYFFKTESGIRYNNRVVEERIKNLENRFYLTDYLKGGE